MYNTTTLHLPHHVLGILSSCGVRGFHDYVGNFLAFHPLTASTCYPFPKESYRSPHDILNIQSGSFIPLINLCTLFPFYSLIYRICTSTVLAFSFSTLGQPAQLQIHCTEYLFLLSRHAVSSWTMPSWVPTLPVDNFLNFCCILFTCLIYNDLPWTSRLNISVCFLPPSVLLLLLMCSLSCIWLFVTLGL